MSAESCPAHKTNNDRRGEEDGSYSTGEISNSFGHFKFFVSATAQYYFVCRNINFYQGIEGSR